jgi:hypothetical protein
MISYTPLKNLKFLISSNFYRNYFLINKIGKKILA